MPWTPLITANLAGAYKIADAKSAGNVAAANGASVTKVPNLLSPGTNDATLPGGSTSPIFATLGLDGNRPLMNMVTGNLLSTGISLAANEPYTIIVMADISNVTNDSFNMVDASDTTKRASFFGGGLYWGFSIFGASSQPRTWPAITVTSSATRGAGVPNTALLSLSSDGNGQMQATKNGVVTNSATDSGYGSTAWGNVAFGGNGIGIYACLVYKGRQLTPTEILAETRNIAENLRDSKCLAGLGNSYFAASNETGNADIRPPYAITGATRFAAPTGMFQRTANAFLNAYPTGYVSLEAVIGFPVSKMITGDGSESWLTANIDPTQTKTVVLFTEITNERFGFGTSAATTQGYMKTMINGILGLGAKRVGALGLWGRGGALGNSATIMSSNTLLSAFAATKPGVVTYIPANEDARWNDPSNSAWWDPDAVHPNGAQHQAVATEFLIPYVLAAFAPELTGITITQDAADGMGRIQFHATAVPVGADLSDLTWSADAGTINPETGLWTPPDPANEEQSCTITASAEGVSSFVAVPIEAEEPILLSIQLVVDGPDEDGKIPIHATATPSDASLSGGTWATDKGTLTVSGSTALLTPPAAGDSAQVCHVTYTVGGVVGSANYTVQPGESLRLNILWKIGTPLE